MDQSSFKLISFASLNSAKYIAYAMALLCLLLYVSLTSVHSSHLHSAETAVQPSIASLSGMQPMFEMHDHSSNACEQLCVMQYLTANNSQLNAKLYSEPAPVHLAMALQLWPGNPEAPPPRQ